MSERMELIADNRGYWGYRELTEKELKSVAGGGCGCGCGCGCGAGADAGATASDADASTDVGPSGFDANGTACDCDPSGISFGTTDDDMDMGPAPVDIPPDSPINQPAT